MRTLILASVSLLIFAARLAPAAAQAPAPSIRASFPVSVVGRDAAMNVVGNLPASCAGREVEVGLFIRDRGDPKVITPFEPSNTARTNAAVSTAGTFSVSFPLPRELPDGPTRVWPGVRGDCVDAPVVDDSLGVELAVLDPVRNPGRTSTVLLSSEALASVSNGPDRTSLGAFLGSVEVRADGERCTGVATDGVSAGSPPLALRLGEAGQPAACSRAGARLTFFNSRGQRLFVEMELIPGVTRLLDNFAAAPPGTGDPSPVGVAPNPPATGQLPGDESRRSTPLGIAGAGLVALAALLGALGFAVRHRA